MIPFRNLLVQMFIIITVASTIGLLWNRQMLIESWTGTIKRSPQTIAPDSGRLPLPLGITQVKELFDRGEGFVIDARDATVFAQGHIKGAYSFPLSEFPARLAALRKQAPTTVPFVIYCNGYGCHDSMDLGKKLIQAGFGEIFVFEGGYPEWQEAGYPIEGRQP